jgi:hypothetical protein
VGWACGTYGANINAYRVLVVEPRGKKHLEDLGVYGRKILKYIFEKQNGRDSVGLVWLRMGTSGGLL